MGGDEEHINKWSLHYAKKNIFIIFLLGRRDNTNQIFIEHEFVKIHDIGNLQTYLFVYNSLFIFHNNSGFQFKIQNINTRYSNELVTPRHRASQAQHCALYKGSHLRNQLPEEIKCCSS